LAWSEFHKSKKGVNGYRVHCKECCAKYKAQYYFSPEGKAKTAQSQAKYRASPEAKVRKAQTEARLAQRNKEINKKRDVYGPEAIALYGETKWCKSHNTFHPRTKEFWALSSRQLDGLSGGCKGKITDYHYKRTYGLNPQEISLLRQHSNNCCYLCGKPANGDTLHIDHKEQPGKPKHRCDKEYVRGILCNECNTRIIPLFEHYENTYLLAKFHTAFVQQVFEYLRNPPAQQLLKIST